MTPKEKAIELVVKFKHTAYSDYLTTDNEYNNAKQCALIAVEEILNVIVGTYDFDVLNQYWQEVKKEIENL